jgi:hypothetical protein
MNVASIISLLSACTALVASIFGPVIALTIARRQINASVVTSNRQKRIETLRDALSHLIALISGALVVKSKWKDNWDRGRGAMNSDPALLKKFEDLVLATVKIRLLINPTDPDHRQLYEAIADASKRLQAELSMEEETLRDIEVITALAQAILKREWQRVKRGN